MYFKPLLLPLLAQAALTFIVMAAMYRKRVMEMAAKQIHPQRVSTRDKSRSVLTDSAGAADNYCNLFESPVLFYTAILLALSLLQQDFLIVVLAWAYVFTRAIHSFIHVTYNRVMHRFYAFIASSFILFALWMRLGWIIIQS